MNNFSKQFSKRLKELRLNAELSQEEIAEKLGVSPKTVSYWENGHNAITFNKIPVIAEVLGVPVYKLFVFGDLSSEDNTEIIEILNSMTKKERKTIATVAKAILMLK